MTEGGGLRPSGRTTSGETFLRLPLVQFKLTLWPPSEQNKFAHTPVKVNKGQKHFYSSKRGCKKTQFS